MSRDRSGEPEPTFGAAQSAREGERIARTMQHDERIPALTAAVVRPNRPEWTVAVGEENPGTAATADSQFRMGSITKTFTATLVMQLRDEGKLDLDDRLDQHLTVPEHGDLTIRTMLSHTSGLQREPHGDIWDELSWPGSEQLHADLARVERVLPPARRWHYSNLAYALLGDVVATLRGVPWTQALHEQILEPVGLHRTTTTSTPPVATGYLVAAYTDQAHAEPTWEDGSLASAGMLWSTAPDLARWLSFLADPDPDVLAPETVAEMCQPVTMVDPVDWHTGWGLGLIIANRPGRTVHVGHDGAMPGYLAGAYVDRVTKVAAAAMGSCGTAGDTVGLATQLIEASLAADPPDVEPWCIGDGPPAGLVTVLGPWWTEGTEFVFAWHDGHLQARARAAAKERPPAVFEPAGTEDTFRVTSGRETGELLRLTRDSDGTVSKMHWASYPVTRSQETFGPSAG